MSERNGIEIDYCPQCRGVWLDRGELDKIIDRAGAQAPAGQVPVAQAPATHPPLTQAPQYPQQQGYAQQGQPYKKKRENWLSELFELGG